MKQQADVHYEISTSQVILPRTVSLADTCVCKINMCCKQIDCPELQMLWSFKACYLLSKYFPTILLKGVKIACWSNILAFFGG